jgi:hypothetical protein
MATNGGPGGPLSEAERGERGRHRVHAVELHNYVLCIMYVQQHICMHGRNTNISVAICEA